MFIDPVFRSTYYLKGNSWFDLKEAIVVWHENDSELKIIDDDLYVGDNLVEPLTHRIKSTTYWTKVVRNFVEETDRELSFYNAEEHTLDEDIVQALKSLEGRYGNHYLVCVEKRHEDDPVKMRWEFTLGCMNLMNNVELAYNKYKPILSLYKDKEANLLAKIENVSNVNSRFNDTPQNGGSWDDDNHTTNITQMSSSTSSDGDTIMRRLDEIRRLWRSVFDEMVDYISNILVEGSNL